MISGVVECVACSKAWPSQWIPARGSESVGDYSTHLSMGYRSGGK